METNGRVSAKADVTYFISLALKKEISWNGLTLVLDGITWTNEQCKAIVKLLLKEIEVLQGQLELKESQGQEFEDLNECVFENSFSKRPIEKPEIDTDIKFENDDQDIQDLSEDAITTLDTEDKENEFQHAEFEAISLEDQPNKLIDNEYYTFVSDEIVARSENYETINKARESMEYSGTFSNEQLHMASESVVCAKECIKKQKRFQCKICKDVFKFRSHLTEHERIHSREKPYKCNNCPKTFRWKSAISIHKRIHTGANPYQCKICSKSFSQQSNLDRHERIHAGESPFNCKICIKSFKQKIHLQRHETVHTGEKPFKCKTCPKSYTQYNNLRIHERSHAFL